MVTSREGEGGNMGWVEFEYKTGSRMYCTIQETQPMVCNNCKWKVAFKNFIKIYLPNK